MPHGLAAPAWRGNHVCRARVVIHKDRRRTSTASSPSGGAIGLVGWATDGHSWSHAMHERCPNRPYAPPSSAAARCRTSRWPPEPLPLLQRSALGVRSLLLKVGSACKRVFGFAHLLSKRVSLMSLPTSPSLHATLLVPHGRPVYAPLAPRVSLCARARQLLNFCCKWSCLALMTFVFVSSSGCPCQPSP